jgi:hypothetical protein
MALRTTESVQGVLLLDTANRRNQVRNTIESYLNRQRFDPEGTPALLDAPDGKYGAGFGLIVVVRFFTQSDADEVWADMQALNPNFVLTGSKLTLLTSTEDITADPPVNDALIRDERAW